MSQCKVQSPLSYNAERAEYYSSQYGDLRKPMANTPLLPTSVIGSHAYPAWLLAGLEAIEAGKFGETDRKELFDDAVNIAIMDQESAGIDIITDGEMPLVFCAEFLSPYEWPGKAGASAQDGRVWL